MKKRDQVFFLGCVLTALALFSQVPLIEAETYPTHTIQVVIPGAPGDAVDLAGRVAIEELEKILKVPVIVINKPGGGASVGTDFVAKAKKDGYTLLYSMSSGLVYNPAFNPDEIPYNTLRDFDPLALHVTSRTAFGFRPRPPGRISPRWWITPRRTRGNFAAERWA